MSNIKVYNRMSIDQRDINVVDKSSQNHQVPVGGNTPDLSFAEGESVLIAMSTDVFLDNGCWIVFPVYCDYDFIRGNPPALTELIYGNKKVLSIDAHKPTWILKISNRAGARIYGDPPPEPNITIGDNQKLSQKKYELGMALEQYTQAVPPERVEEEIKTLVIRAIAFMSGYPFAEITPGMELEIDLGLTAYQRKALATAFLRIAKMFNPDARISRSQCENLKTVQDAIDLVKKAAGIQTGAGRTK